MDNVTRIKKKIFNKIFQKKSNEQGYVRPNKERSYVRTSGVHPLKISEVI
ncbi:unnamed protein product [Nezara viridula]|uniref:Uncharacterized protein n=1 Tax=Nezara viridula TaxID=85310 RepID=A0A9P0HKB5_NEZVI|nr:unnamed protein product [Nezara viridula]